VFGETISLIIAGAPWVLVFVAAVVAVVLSWEHFVPARAKQVIEEIQNVLFALTIFAAVSWLIGAIITGSYQ